MKRWLILGVAMLFAGTASAQLYRWVDENGRVRYTDRPPPAGVKSRTIGAPTTPSAPSAPSGDAGEGKGPLSPAEQEQAFQKRRQEAQKAAEKSAAAEKEASDKAENCRRSREALNALQSGERISRTNAQGERYFLDDSARDGELQAAQRSVQQWCG